MAMTPEAKIKAAVKKAIKAAGLYYMMPVTGGFGTSGDPDIFVCAGGLLITIETKVDCLRHRRGELYRGKRIKANAPTLLQQQRMAELRRAGAITLVVDRHNVSALPELLSSAMCETQAPQSLFAARTGVIESAEALDLYYDVIPDTKVQ